ACNPPGYLTTEHPKVMTKISTVLIIVGGIVLLPGFSEWVGGTILGHPAVKVAGAIAFAIGQWLKAK
ncbi:hypothetical protein BJV74DRAFT_717806, partial [Russula compacta]